VGVLPPPDNDYRGSKLAIAFVWLLIAQNAFRGWVHVFWADSGAGRIAGIDLSQNGAPVVSLLASIGIDQLAWLVLELGVVTRYRRWIPTLLAFVLAKYAAAAWLLWLWKPLGVEAPAKLGSLVGVPIVAAALWLSLTRATPLPLRTQRHSPEGK